MQLSEWIAKYEKKAEKFELLPGFQIYYEPDKGFFCWHKFGDVFEIDHTCTENVTWAHDKCVEMAKARGCKMLRTATSRDPSGYMRLTKSTPNIALSGIRPNGTFYWIMEKKVI
jgi:hypothetical protein